MYAIFLPVLYKILKSSEVLLPTKSIVNALQNLFSTDLAACLNQQLTQSAE